MLALRWVLGHHAYALFLSLVAGGLVVVSVNRLRAALRGGRRPRIVQRLLALITALLLLAASLVATLTSDGFGDPAENILLTLFALVFVASLLAVRAILPPRPPQP